MSGKTFTQEQILSGIRIFWKEALESESPFDPDMRLDEQPKTVDLFDDYDVMELIGGLEGLFGFSCTFEEWSSFFGLPIRNPEAWKKDVAPRLTFRGLADFIRERLTPIALEPVILLGKPCLTAGVFRSLEQLASQVNPSVARFAPSTPIRQRLQGICLHQFWSRLRWILQDQLPPAPVIDLSFRPFLHSLSFKFALGIIIAMWRRDLKGFFTGIMISFGFLGLVAWIIEFINSRLNPLPKGIETFGDLARVLAAIILDQQSECASCSTP